MALGPWEKTRGRFIGGRLFPREILPVSSEEELREERAKEGRSRAEQWDEGRGGADGLRQGEKFVTDWFMD